MTHELYAPEICSYNFRNLLFPHKHRLSNLTRELYGPEICSYNFGNSHFLLNPD
jgi:hypothetical protein